MDGLRRIMQNEKGNLVGSEMHGNVMLNLKKGLRHYARSRKSTLRLYVKSIKRLKKKIVSKEI